MVRPFQVGFPHLFAGVHQCPTGFQGCPTPFFPLLRGVPRRYRMSPPLSGLFEANMGVTGARRPQLENAPKPLAVLARKTMSLRRECQKALTSPGRRWLNEMKALDSTWLEDSLEPRCP